jgi:hypothetical protein
VKIVFSPSVNNSTDARDTSEAEPSLQAHFGDARAFLEIDPHVGGGAVTTWDKATSDE